MSVRAMDSTLHEGAPGSNRGNASPLRPAAVQMSFDPVRNDTMQKDQSVLAALFVAMVAKFGGVDALVSALNRKPSYVSKITEAMNGGEGRAIQLEWLAPMLRDPRCAELLLSCLSEVCGYAPPVFERALTPEQTAETVTEVVAEMSGLVRESIRAEVAKRRGVRIEDVKL